MSLDDLLANPETVLNWAVELSSTKISDGTSLTWKFAVLPIDNTETIRPYLSQVGPFDFALAEDLLFSGLASANFGSLTLVDTAQSGYLDDMLDYTFADQACVIKVGDASAAYSAYFTYRTCTIDVEPSITLFSANINLRSPLARLQQEAVTSTKYVGVPTCLRSLTSTGSVVITRLAAAHDLTRFTIMVRFRAADSSGGNFTLFRKLVSATTDSNWRLILNSSEEVVFDNTAGGAVDISISSSGGLYADGAWHSVIAAYDYTGGASGAYLIVDNEVIGTDTPGGTAPDLSATDPVFAVRNAGGDDIDVCDLRLYDYFMSQEEALAIVATQSDGTELGCVGLWRCDDGAGSSVNDYSSNNRDGAIGGTVNVDYSWEPTDLGGPELVGALMPIPLGVPYNARAHQVDTARGRYRIADSDVVTGSETETIRSRGVALTAVTDYSDEGGGVYETVSAESQPITYDIVTGSPTAIGNTWPRLVTDLLTNRTTIPINGAQEISLPNLLPWLAGYYIDQESTAAQIVAELCSGGLFYSEAADGAFFLDFLLPPMGLGPYSEPCIDFRGDTHYFNFGDIADLTGSSGTVACWWKTFAVSQGPNDYGVTSSEQVLIDKIVAGTAGYRLDYVTVGTNAGKIRFTIKGSGSPATTELYSPAGLVEDNAWHFTCGVFDDSANTMAVFHAKLGAPLVQVASASSVTSTIGNSSEPLTAGYTLWGSMCYLQVWSVAKTLAQMQAFMTTPPVGNEANLAAYSGMKSGSGETVLEVVSATNATITTSYPRWRWVPRLTVNLSETPSARLKDYHILQPAWSINLRYGRNWTPMSDADIAASVSDSTRLDLKREWKSVPWASQTVRGRYRRARRLTIDTPILRRVDAERLVKMLAFRYSEGRATGTLELPAGLPAARKAINLGFGDEVRILSSLHGLSGGRDFRVAGSRVEPLTGAVSNHLLG